MPAMPHGDFLGVTLRARAMRGRRPVPGPGGFSLADLRLPSRAFERVTWSAIRDRRRRQAARDTA